MTEEQKASGKKPYKVLRIDELSKLADGGGIVAYYRCQIKTTGGVVLSVNLDKEDFKPDKAEKIFTEKAIEADKILAS